MSVPAATWRPAPFLALRRLMARHPVAAFLAILQMFGRVVIMWLHNATGYSVLLVGLWHSSFDATTSAFGRTFVLPGPAGSAALSGFWIPSAVVAEFAALVVVFTRGRFSYRPDRAPWPADATPQGGTLLSHV